MTPEDVARHAGRAAAMRSAYEFGDAATFRALVAEAVADDPAGTFLLLAGLAVAFAESTGALSGRTVYQVLRRGAATLRALALEDEALGS